MLKVAGILLSAIAAVTAASFSAVFAAGQTVEATVPSSTPAPLAHLTVEQVRHSVFMVLATKQGNVLGGGTGFVVAMPSGQVMILTNRHVCETHLGDKDDTFRLEAGDNAYTGIAVAKSDLDDLCLIMPNPAAVHGRLPLKLADGVTAPGAAATVFGHPQLRPLTRTDGHYLFSSHEWEPVGGEAITLFSNPIIGHTDVHVEPGNSGSPVVDQDNEVIGIIHELENETKHGLYIPASSIDHFLNTLE